MATSDMKYNKGARNGWENERNIIVFIDNAIYIPWRDINISLDLIVCVDIKKVHL